ncbi:unnamed protein product [Amoebophrya sp. A120]|nr:unnamed protein product [Amoebophrya sp. A120]|eukprot:GSA120T00025982001.1
MTPKSDKKKRRRSLFEIAGDRHQQEQHLDDELPHGADVAHSSASSSEEDSELQEALLNDAQEQVDRRGASAIGTFLDEDGGIDAEKNNQDASFLAQHQLQASVNRLRG